jgi:exodeoxyribonuclease VII small subunit
MTRTKPSRASTSEAAATSETPEPDHPGTETTQSFEAAIAELGAIVERLEEGELPLEESLGLFEKGVMLSRQAQQRLDRAEKRVEELLGFDTDDTPLTRKLDES